MPRSVYRPLRHMSHSPCAQAAHGTGSGRRTMPTTMVAGGEAAAVRRLEHAAERFVAEHQPLAARRRPAIGPGDDLAIGAADAQREGLDEQGPGSVGGSGRSSSCTELGVPGMTVSAFTICPNAAAPCTVPA